MTPIRPGDEVECIDDSSPPEQYLGIKAGDVYVVEWIGLTNSYLSGTYTGLRLAGVRRGTCPQFGDDDPPFRVSRFRKLVGPSAKSKTREVELS